MTSCDTNILLHAYNADSRSHAAAVRFLRGLRTNAGFVVCELVLVELYILLRNPAVVARPLSAHRAVEVCRQYRQNLCWGVVDYPGGLMEEIWQRAAREDFGRRCVFDARLALTLRYHGVSDFATANVKHFTDYGFDRVWDPLTS